ncbi:Uncharacterized protein HZ326_29911 [Fusarium oxysporum f. sp. albedinis]|nr:Uncharacterized protein HZ326_29911 [Fusarium oxysporum f. sp. albedinis]
MSKQSQPVRLIIEAWLYSGQQPGLQRRRGSLGSTRLQRSVKQLPSCPQSCSGCDDPQYQAARCCECRLGSRSCRSLVLREVEGHRGRNVAGSRSRNVEGMLWLETATRIGVTAETRQND